MIVCVLVFTAEQFQEHQEQLALMQKQQLEQIQQQASDNNTQVCVCLSVWIKDWEVGISFM